MIKFKKQILLLNRTEYLKNINTFFKGDLNFRHMSYIYSHESNYQIASYLIKLNIGKTIGFFSSFYGIKLFYKNEAKQCFYPYFFIGRIDKLINLHNLNQKEQLFFQNNELYFIKVLKILYYFKFKHINISISKILDNLNLYNSYNNNLRVKKILYLFKKTSIKFSCKEGTRDIIISDKLNNLNLSTNLMSDKCVGSSIVLTSLFKKQFNLYVLAEAIEKEIRFGSYQRKRKHFIEKMNIPIDSNTTKKITHYLNTLLNNNIIKDFQVNKTTIVINKNRKKYKEIFPSI